MTPEITPERLQQIKELMHNWFLILEFNGDYELGPNECTLAIRELINAVEYSNNKGEIK